MTTHTGGVVIDLVAVEVLSLAMAHNGIAFVRDLWIHNNGPAVHAATLQVEVTDAEGSLSHHWELLMDVVEGDLRLTSDDVKPRLDPAQMFQLTERHPATIRAWIVSDGETIAETRQDVIVLAGAQWIGGGGGLAFELLAAHVMPNSPDVAELLNAASQILKQRTGSPSLEGYQSGVQRVDQIVEAIYLALQARGITYVEPPASWGEIGQKVRTPTEVLVDRVGTCLDTTVVFAACLEQAGIRPLLWVLTEHAFLGYWREEAALDAIAQIDVVDVVNRVDLGHIGLIETTDLTGRESAVSFLDAQAHAASHLRGDLDDVRAVVDVWTARHGGLLPLPARVRGSDGSVHLVEYRAAEHSPTDWWKASEVRPAERGDKAVLPPRVQQWKNALLDLSLRNRLINFTTRYALELSVPATHIGHVEDALHEGRRLILRPSDDVDGIVRARGIQYGHQLAESERGDLLGEKGVLFVDVTSAAYLKRLRNLAAKARLIVEETGANNLYLALGSLVWSHDGKDLRSPLILVPVTLTTRARDSAYKLELDESGTSTPNYCLLEKLHQLHGMTIPGLANPVADHAGIDVDAAFRAMREAIVEHGLPYRVESTAHVAILQFAKFRLWKDIDEHWDILERSPLAHHLAHNPTGRFEDPSADVENGKTLDELAASCPIPADSSQLEAISAAVNGRTFVLEGPPGTGKSQTITNLLVRAMSEGKRVLFVAEKRAALDVVKTRLDKIGFADLSLDLHDKGSKPAVVRAQIKAAMDHAVVVDREGLSASTEDVASASRNLSRYASRLHEQNGARLSLYSAATSLHALGDVVDGLDVPASLLSESSATTVQALEDLLRRLPEVADPARPGLQHPWGFTTVDQVTSDAVRALQAAAVELDVALAHLETDAPELSAVLRIVTDISEVAALEPLLRARGLTLPTLDETRTSRWRSASAAMRAEVDTFVAAAHPGLDIATPHALELPLADIHARAQAAAASNWFGRKKRLQVVLEELAPGLRPGSKLEPKHVPDLASALLQLQGAVNHLAGRATALPGVMVPGGWNPLTSEGREVVSRQVAWLEWAGETVNPPIDDLPTFKNVLRTLLGSGAVLSEGSFNQLQRLTAALRRVVDITGATSRSIDEWRGTRGLLEQWKFTSDRRDSTDPSLGTFTRWVALRAHTRPLVNAEMVTARRLLLDGLVNADDAVRAFRRGLVDASILERRRATGLDGFDIGSHERTIARFRRAGAEVRAALPNALVADVLSSRPFDASIQMGRIGELQRELDKQRRGLGVRRLLEKYGDLVTQLSPCVLVSPDSLARFFPVESGLFDLVVFDEASQVRVADAIGAIGRARSVVIVGDSKQMPPTAVAESTLDFDEDDPSSETVVEDQESILSEGVAAGLHRHWLSWHYRSQDESLIAFSNRRYYEGRLSSFPAPVTTSASASLDGHGINLQRVDGTFHRSGKGKLLRTNPVEAEAVLKEIRRRFDATPAGTTPSLGVITFNQQQRAYIEELIRDCADHRLAEALDSTEGEGLFVKNLENVQGDERDVILFSTAFSVNEKGVLPLNFGPLNRGGGERRLNVAITRARRQVIVFSSFAPQQLRAEETSSIGLKHLRAYLDIAAGGAEELEGPLIRSSVKDRHRDDVAKAIRARGYEVRTDVGLSDFRVDLVVSAVTGGAPLAAVLLDGRAWADRRTVGDRDGLPKDVLQEMLRWPRVLRIWLPAWLTSRDEVLDDLENQLSISPAQPSKMAEVDGPLPYPDRLKSAWGKKSTPEEFTESAIKLSNVTAQMSSSVPATPDRAVPIRVDLPGELRFEAWDPPALGARSVLDTMTTSRSARDEVQRAVIQVVEAEGPIHVDRLAKLVAAAFDLTRVSTTRVESITAQIPATLGRPRDGFVWPVSKNAEQWRGFRGNEIQTRPVEHIALEELANAMLALCDVSGGIEHDELLRETLAVFGGRRITQGISARLQKASSLAIESGRIAIGTHGTFVVGHDPRTLSALRTERPV